MKTKKLAILSLIICIVALCLVCILSCCSKTKTKQDAPSNPTTDTYTLTYTVENGGKIIGSRSQTVNKGQDGESVYALAGDAYEFIGWSDGVQTAERQDTNVTADITVTANFVRIYELSYSAGVGGTIQGSVSQSVRSGQDGSEIVAVVDDAYEFIGWSDGVKTAERQDTNVTEDISVTATFALRSYTLKYSAGVGGSVSGSFSQTVQSGKNGTAVVAVPDNQYEFIGWSDGVQTAERQDTNVTSDITVTATFMQYNPEFAGGIGTQSYPYKIANKEQLLKVEQYPEANFILIKDITLTENFTPLLSHEVMFNGDFDGNEHKISNLTVNNTATFYSGLFSCIGSKGSVKNLTLENVNISGTNYIGGIAGYSLGSITGCTVNGEINYIPNNSNNVFIGGIVGNIENGAIDKCTTDVEIVSSEVLNGEAYIGGLCGKINNSGKTVVTESHTEGNIAFENTNTSNRVNAGGLFGQSSEADIKDSYSTGNVSTTSSFNARAGGLVGFVSGSITITNSYSTGNVSSATSNIDNADAGGLVGFGSGFITITNSYSTGDISATSDNRNAYAGGMVGSWSGSITITNTYSAGDISATSNFYNADAGGMVGFNSGSITITNSYSTGNVSATANRSAAYAGGMVGHSMANLTIRFSYTVSKITVSGSGTKYIGGFAGRADSISLENAHWLYYADSGVEYAVGGGVLTNIGATKHTNIADFYTLADILNGNSNEQVWENRGSSSLPTLSVSGQ